MGPPAEFLVGIRARAALGSTALHRRGNRGSPPLIEATIQYDGDVLIVGKSLEEIDIKVGMLAGHDKKMSGHRLVGAP